MADEMTARQFSTLRAIAEEIRNGDQLLLRSAEVMRHQARSLCERNGSVRSDSCEPYHGWWQYWRLVGLAATPNWHAQLYRDFFSNVLDKRECGILACGVADYGLLDHLTAAIPDGLRARTRITVLDLCRTPLAICAWYRERYEEVHRHELNLSYCRADALRAPFPDESFDLVTSYAFLTRFPDGQQEALVREWHRILRPGGRVVTTVRLARPGTRRPITLDADAFSSQVKQRIADHKPWLLPVVETIGFLAFEYARVVIDWDVPSLAHLHELFGGFDRTLRSSVVEKTFEGQEEYVRVLAVKR